MQLITATRKQKLLQTSSWKATAQSRMARYRIRHEFWLFLLELHCSILVLQLSPLVFTPKCFPVTCITVLASLLSYAQRAAFHILRKSAYNTMSLTHWLIRDQWCSLQHPTSPLTATGGWILKTCGWAEQDQPPNTARPANPKPHRCILFAYFARHWLGLYVGGYCSFGWVTVQPPTDAALWTLQPVWVWGVWIWRVWLRCSIVVGCWFTGHSFPVGWFLVILLLVVDRVTLWSKLDRPMLSKVSGGLV